MFAIATIICISSGNAYASNELTNGNTPDNKLTAVSTGNTEKSKAEFAYEMAQITEKIVSAPTTNVESFKSAFSYATAQVIAKIMPLLPNDQKSDFAYEMAQFTTNVISTPNLDIEKTKADFAYKMAQLTAKIITNGTNIAIGQSTGSKTNNTSNDQKTSLLRNNADVERKATSKANKTGADRKAIVYPGDVTPETYTRLIDELKRVGDRGNQPDNKVNIEGEIDYYYAFHRGSPEWSRDMSAVNTRLDFTANISKDWSVNATLQRQKTITSDKYEFDSRLSIAGKVGTTKVNAGSFGYFMAEGNIYDGGFKGVRVDTAGPVKYTLSFGETDFTQQTYIATARYNDFNYNLEAGVYHYQMPGLVENTIWTLGGNYNFSNFSVGAMYLGSSLKDSKGSNNGYVFSLNYGDLKTYKPGTYDVFVKYYNQPQYTYIEHTMNGLADLMQGFRGFGIGTHYTVAKNMVAGIELYDLKDKVSGNKGKTVWGGLSWYF